MFGGVKGDLDVRGHLVESCSSLSRTRVIVASRTSFALLGVAFLGVIVMVNFFAAWLNVPGRVRRCTEIFA